MLRYFYVLLKLDEFLYLILFKERLIILLYYIIK